MNHIEQSCPFEAAARAAHCESCFDRNNSLTPCVRALFRSSQAIVPVRASAIPIALVDRLAKAA